MLTNAQVVKIKATIASTLKAHAFIAPAKTKRLLPVKNLQGKLYEAHVLSCVIRDLATLEKCTIKLKSVRGATLMFKQKGSPINKAYPYFEIYRNGVLLGELFTDTEFTTLSAATSPPALQRSDYHELDIAVFTPGCTGRPTFDNVILAIECKATIIEKSTFRELLGFRRELTMLSPVLRRTKFRHWPIARVRAFPSSVHMCYSTDPAIINYSKNGSFFGILMVHESM